MSDVSRMIRRQIRFNFAEKLKFCHWICSKQYRIWKERNYVVDEASRCVQRKNITIRLIRHKSLPMFCHSFSLTYSSSNAYNCQDGRRISEITIKIQFVTSFRFSRIIKIRHAM
ncbi:hypothetical protein Bhyg_01466 [Pseudolycoriella hygida]|uniref:Uncharacterized protein n=1 Tax=Pseudolycoriella hygida TaxID=35572 RepID=A0A9Q0S7K9_9DIPT|nr:hypothetical protein Bhyg_01466 [Pseudolycoriella hygida]